MTANDALALLLYSSVVIVTVLLFIEDTQARQIAQIRLAFFFWLSEMVVLGGLLFTVLSRLQP